MNVQFNLSPLHNYFKNISIIYNIMLRKPILRRQKAINYKKNRKKEIRRQQRKELEIKIAHYEKQLKTQIQSIIKKKKSSEKSILSSNSDMMRKRIGRCYITMEQIKQTRYYKELPTNINKSNLSKVDLCKVIQKQFHIPRIHS